MKGEERNTHPKVYTSQAFPFCDFRTGNLFPSRFVLIFESVMKAFLTTRSDLRWALAVLPALLAGHWLLMSLIPAVLHTPLLQSARAILNLL
jgi:hypothetical protein